MKKENGTVKFAGEESDIKIYEKFLLGEYEVNEKAEALICVSAFDNDFVDDERKEKEEKKFSNKLKAWKRNYEEEKFQFESRQEAARLLGRSDSSYKMKLLQAPERALWLGSQTNSTQAMLILNELKEIASDERNEREIVVKFFDQEEKKNFVAYQDEPFCFSLNRKDATIEKNIAKLLAKIDGRRVELYVKSTNYKNDKEIGHDFFTFSVKEKAVMNIVKDLKAMNIQFELLKNDSLYEFTIYFEEVVEDTSIMSNFLDEMVMNRMWILEENFSKRYMKECSLKRLSSSIDFSEINAGKSDALKLVRVIKSNGKEHPITFESKYEKFIEKNKVSMFDDDAFSEICAELEVTSKVDTLTDANLKADDPKLMKYKEEMLKSADAKLLRAVETFPEVDFVKLHVDARKMFTFVPAIAMREVIDYLLPFLVNVCELEAEQIVETFKKIASIEENKYMLENFAEIEVMIRKRLPNVKPGFQHGLVNDTLRLFYGVHLEKEIDEEIDEEFKVRIIDKPFVYITNDEKEDAKRGSKKAKQIGAEMTRIRKEIKEEKKRLQTYEKDSDAYKTVKELIERKDALLKELRLKQEKTFQMKHLDIVVAARCYCVLNNTLYLQAEDIIKFFRKTDIKDLKRDMNVITEHYVETKAGKKLYKYFDKTKTKAEYNFRSLYKITEMGNRFADKNIGYRKVHLHTALLLLKTTTSKYSMTTLLELVDLLKDTNNKGKISSNELAKRVGTTKQTIVTVTNEFKKAGIIGVDVDPVTLERIYSLIQP